MLVLNTLGVERGFLCHKGSGVKRGVKEKQSSMADKSIKVSKHANEALGSNSATRIPNVVDAGLGSFPIVSKAHGNHSPGSANKENINDASIVNNVANNGTTVGPTLAGNTPGVSTSYANVTSELSRNTMSFHTLITPTVNGVDVVVLVESIRAISERFINMAYDGLDVMLENDLWFIRNNPLIMKKWNPDVNLLKEDVGNIPVWVKLHGVLVMTFSEDSLSAIATKLGTPLMLDSYTSDMCMQSWGRSSYAKAMIELRTDVELKDTIDECPKRIGSDMAKNWKNPSQAPRGVLVCPKVGFKPIKQVYRPLSKKNNVNTSGNKKKDVEFRKEVSNSNPFDVLNSVKNDVDLDSSTSTTPIVDKIDKFEKLIIDGKVTLVDGEGKPLKKERVGFGTNSLLEQWRDIYENDDYDYDPYDDDMYEGQEIPDKVQSICDNLDIKLQGRKKKQVI
ncbi:putative reverse transcriptase domain-containing protein [Tanacetum coccineum]